MAVTRQDRLIHRAFLRREMQHERRYARLFLSVLSKQYREASEAYPEPYTVNPEDYRPHLIQLYSTVLPSEAEIAWNTYVVPLTSEQKDFFDDLMTVMGIANSPGEHIRIWRDVANEWLGVNILSKIQGIANTTQRAIAKVVEDAINQGISITEISKAIREQSNGEVNKSRSVLIARTETVSAMNKGRRMAMYTSNLEWEKKWLDTADDRTRLSHRLIAEQGYRALSADYWLVDRTGNLEPADCPGDPKLSAENICNCRCTETYQVMRDAAGRPIRRDQPVYQVGDVVEFIM